MNGSLKMIKLCINGEDKNQKKFDNHKHIMFGCGKIFNLILEKKIMILNVLR